MKITPAGGFFAFEITPLGLLTKKTSLTPGGVLDATIKELTWEKLLDLATGGIKNKIGEAILGRLLGPTDWEREVSTQLEEIIGKLDTILDEIRELRIYINESQRMMWRDTLQTKLRIHVIALTALMAGARAAGKLEGKPLEFFTLQTNDLYDGLAEITFMTPDSLRPDGIPLYAAVQAGLLMLVVAHRILGIEAATTNSLLSNFITAFGMWHGKIKDLASTKTATIEAEVNFFNSFPHRGALSVGNSEGGGFCPPTDIVRFAVLVNIDGGVEKPYTFVGYELEPFNIREVNSTNFVVFPLPYPSWSSYVDPNTGICGGMGQAGVLAIHMCNMLNVRRNNLLENIENLRKLQLVLTGLSDAQVRFRNLIT